MIELGPLAVELCGVIAPILDEITNGYDQRRPEQIDLIHDPAEDTISMTFRAVSHDSKVEILWPVLYIEVRPRVLVMDGDREGATRRNGGPQTCSNHGRQRNHFGCTVRDGHFSTLRWWY